MYIFRIAETPACKMPAGNLAKVFGPTVVGYSCPEPAPMQIMTETRRQNQVQTLLTCLLWFDCNVLYLKDGIKDL